MNFEGNRKEMMMCATSKVSFRGLVFALVSLAAGIFMNACAGAGVSIVRTELKPGVMDRADLLGVKPAVADKTEFLGDYSDDPPSVEANRELIKNTFAQKLVPALLKAGFKAELVEASVPVGSIEVELVVEKFEAGSSATRAVVGMGAGASYLLTAVRLTKGDQVIADFTIDASSGGRGGFSGIGSFLEQHIDDSVERFVSYLGEKVKP